MPTPRTKRTPPREVPPPRRLESRVLDDGPGAAAHRRVEGFGFTALDDDLFALGYPHLSLLYADEGDPVASAHALVLDGYPYLDVALPRHGATALLRARAGGSVATIHADGTATLNDHALAAVRDVRPLERDEARGLLARLARAGENSIGVLLCIVEAVVGTASTLDLAADALEATPREGFFRRPHLAAMWLDTLALMLDRMPAREAAPRAERLRAWADAAALPEPTRTAAGVGALHAEPCVARPRVVVRAERDALVLARRARAHEPWYTLPDPRLVFLGGEDVYAVELGLWRKYGAPYRPATAHRLILERFGRIRSPSTVALVASMATTSSAKAQARAWLDTHRDFATPHLEALARGDSPHAEAARALLAARG